MLLARGANHVKKHHPDGVGRFDSCPGLAKGFYVL